MWCLLLVYGASALLFFLFALYILYIPLPAEIVDRRNVMKMDVIMRLIWEYPGDVIEFLFGAKIRNRYFRFIMGVIFTSVKPDLSDIEVTKESIGGVEVRVYIPHKRQSRGALVFFHGGGWVSARPEAYDTLIAALIRHVWVTVISVDYRLAPEYPFPVPVNDCEAVVKNLYENSYQKYDIDREKICIVGDSAGGNLAAVVAQRFARRNEHFIKCQVLIYPVIHVFGFHLPSYLEYYEKYNGTTLLSPRSMARMMLLYLDIPATRRNIELLTASQHISKKLRSSAEFRKVLCLEKDFDPYERFPLRIRKPDENDEAQMKAFANKGADPDVSALFGVRRDLPPAMVVTAEFDVLRDEAIQYAKKLQEVGVSCEWKHYKTAFHGLCTLPDTPVANHIIEDVCCFLDGNLGYVP